MRKNRKEIGLIILQGINRKGWTVQQAAEKMNRNENEIYKWIKNTPNFKLKTIVQLELELNISLILNNV